MRKIFGSVFNDIKKNKFFTILIMLEILVLVIVAGSVMMTFNLDGVRKKPIKSNMLVLR